MYFIEAVSCLTCSFFHLSRGRKEVWDNMETVAFAAKDMHFKIRHARKEDCKEVSRMIMELAVYEKMPDQVKISPEELERDGFCQNPFFECLVAEVPEEHKSKEGFTVVGYALYFYTYSTWKGRSLYLEDLYVMPEFRGNGIGKGLLSKVAESRCGLQLPSRLTEGKIADTWQVGALKQRVGKKKQCVRLQLSVLNWNTPTLDFYAAKGAQDLTVSEGWHFIRFDEQNMGNLANEAPKDQ